MADTHNKELSQQLKLALDFLPLVGFFLAYKFYGMYAATGFIMAATAASLVIQFIITRRLAKFPLYSAILVGVMGGLTLYMHNDTFFKMKPTAANLLFAVVLGGGLMAGRTFLKDLMGSAVHMNEQAWHTLTWRWVVFFVAMAVLNEIVWRNLSEATWVNFKVFGLMGLTLVFALANAPYMARHMHDLDAKDGTPGSKHSADG